MPKKGSFTIPGQIPGWSELEEALVTQFKQLGVPEPERQLIIPGRKFAYDFGWRDYRLVTEVQGGTFSKRRNAHSSGIGLQRDYQKNNHAVINGWRVIYADATMINDYSFATYVVELFNRLKGDLS